MFEPIKIIQGSAAPLPAANIDTDIIIRIERLTAGDFNALGGWAFESWRYLDDGGENPDFPLNVPKWRNAKVLLAGPNFGCGSSREPAVNAILQMGIQCVIAESFGEIFFANCFQNGLLPIRLPEQDVAALRDESGTGQSFEIDLVAQVVSAPSGRQWGFEIDPAKKEALMAGLDDMGLTLQHLEDIQAWQARDALLRPWVWNLPNTDNQGRSKLG